MKLLENCLQERENRCFMHNVNIDQEFKRIFPSLASEFELKPLQKDAIKSVIDSGNTLCIMPTGGGKSIIYYLSGMLSGGITLVVSPLIALMCEQEQKLNALGVETLALHGGISTEKQFESLKNFAWKRINPRFIFVSPEKLATDGFFEYCIRCRNDEIKLITIDEIHCVSQWGLQFRPFYKEIPSFIEKVFSHNSPKILGLTATLNPRELIDITESFKISRQNVLKDENFMRTEITLNVLEFQDEDKKEKKLWELLKIHSGEKTLVYIYRKRGGRSVADFAERAQTEYSFKAACFHGNMDAKERSEIVAKFKNGDINIVFATNAFGMGIDIKDVRVVIHYWIPESIEQYYQEIGRAARDQMAANAYLLFSEKNIGIKRDYFIDRSFPNHDTLQQVFEKISNSRTGLTTLNYFDDEESAKCLQYFLACGVVQIVAKGFGSFSGLKNTTNKRLLDLCKLTKKQLLISTVKRADLPVEDIVDLVYSSILSKETVAEKLDKCLIVNISAEKLSDEMLKTIDDDIDAKRKYRHDLLNMLIHTLEATHNSIELHQEIGRYLGANKDSLGKIYATVKGDYVRSKSEVIIANLLYSNGIEYEYEKDLSFSDGKIRPDFTVKTPSGETFYWEHLGMLGLEEYDNTWLYKKNIYDREFCGKLKITYEGLTLSTSAQQVIDELLTL